MCLTGALLGAPVATCAQDAPRRVVSMNLCTDQLAMLIADQDQLYSVSHLAADPRSSAMAKQSQDYRVNHGRAEEIYLMAPDLVIVGSFTLRATVDMLRRLGITVEVFEPAYALNDVRTGLLRMGEVLNQRARAAALVADFDAQLARYIAQVHLRPRAALYYANGYTSGDKTLAGEILTAAGLSNIAAELGYGLGGTLPLEVLAMAQPEAVITGQSYPGTSRAEQVKAHPVVRRLQSAVGTAPLTDRDWVCGTPFVLRAINDMVTLRRRVGGNQP